MARSKTSKSGVPVRYFAVLYDAAERKEHNAALNDLICAGHSTMFFGAAPGKGGTFIAFAIAEDQADAYVRRIKSARRAARVAAQSATE